MPAVARIHKDFITMRPLLALLFLSFVFAAAAPAAAAPLTCDSELQTFSTEGKLMRATSKYVYKLPPDVVADDPVALDDAVETYLDNSVASVAQLRDDASSAAGIKGPVTQGSVWRVTGEPLCVEEPQLNGAVTIYVPVERYDAPNQNGWLIESRNWKNIDLNTLTVNAPAQVLRRLSLYFLEPQIVNPDIQLNILDFAAPEPEPPCYFGALTHVRIGDAAYRYGYTEEMADVETTWDVEWNLTVGWGGTLPLFEETAFANQGEQVDVPTWYNFMYRDFKAGLSPYGVTQVPVPYNTEIQILDGPVCTHTSSHTQLVAQNQQPIMTMYDIARITWYRVRLTQDNQQVEGWFPESTRWTGITMNFVAETVTTRYDFAAYFMGPEASDTGGQDYIDNWLLDGDLTIGESGTRYPASTFGASRLAAPAAECTLSLPTRLGESTRARVVAEALNMRGSASLNSTPLIGLGQNSIVRLTGISTCADGHRWWSASVTGGALGATVLTGWVAEHDSAVYFLEPLTGTGPGEFLARPTAVPPTATATPTPLPLVNPTAQPTARPTDQPTATPTDPIPG
jgi:hypothetical protein